MSDNSFERAWAPLSESSANVAGRGVERGARAILRQDALIKKASWDNVSVGDTKEVAFDQVYANPGPNFKRLAFAMQGPLKDRNDYVAVGRKLLLTDELPQGEVPFYDLDIPEYPALIVGARSTPPVMEANIARINIPTYSITMTSHVHQEEIAIRRYPAFDRAKERVAISIAIAEDEQVFALLKKAVAVGPNTEITVTGATGLQRTDMNRAYASLLSNNLAPGAYVGHPMRYAYDMMSWNSDQVDQATLNVMVETGQFGVLNGTRVILSVRLDPTKFYMVTTPDKLGRIPERKACEIQVAHKTWETRYAITAWEQVGFGIHNSAGVVGFNLTNGSLPMPGNWPRS